MNRYNYEKDDSVGFWGWIIVLLVFSIPYMFGYAHAKFTTIDNICEKVSKEACVEIENATYPSNEGTQSVSSSEISDTLLIGAGVLYASGVL